MLLEDKEYDEYISPPTSSMPPPPVVRKYFPETVLLSITAHGSIATYKKSFSFEEVIPDSKVIIANATAPGVCNYLTSYHIESLNELLMEEYESFDKTKSMEEFVPLVLRSIKLHDYYNMLTDKKKQKQHSPDSQNYINLFNRGYNYQIRRNKDYIIDKSYQLSPEENKERLEFREENKSYNSIMVLNMKDPYGKQGVDLLDIVPPTISVNNYKYLTLKNAIEYLNKNGAKNIMIFDYSCNDYDSNEIVTPRYERSLRRQYIKDYDVKDSTKKRKRIYSTASKSKKSSSKKSRKYKTSNEDLKLLESINVMPIKFNKTRKTKSANDINSSKVPVVKQKNTI